MIALENHKKTQPIQACAGNGSASPRQMNAPQKNGSGYFFFISNCACHRSLGARLTTQDAPMEIISERAIFRLGQCLALLKPGCVAN
ncbi:MAG: hypothetical protein JMDDDDMK_03985 [Acidobacteria bacterium]|nr:hypothetical protein [Acidobacteriota bacterium]